jgi:uncharacterized double-CXXCG motif protein
VLAEQVRPHLPTGVVPVPGMQFGPLRGTATGEFGPVTVHRPWELLVRQDALEQLVAAGLRGLVPVRTELQGLGEALPLYELEPTMAARVHPDCVQTGPTCATCGYHEHRLMPDWWLDEGSLPEDLDVFRAPDAPHANLVSERFAEAIERLGPSDVTFRELAVAPKVRSSLLH